MGRGTLRKVQGGSETHSEVQDGLGNPRRGLGRVGGPSGRFGMGRRTLGKV